MSEKFVFEIPASRFDALVERFAKYLRRTRKTLTTPPTFEVIFERDEEKTVYALDEKNMLSVVLDAQGTPVTRWERYSYVVVNGIIPKVSGWEFVATLDHSEGETLIRAVPGAGNLPLEYRSNLPVCNHCNTARNRTETYVLRNATGQYKQVGRNCLADFFPQGVGDAMATFEAIVEAIAMITSDEDEERSEVGYGERYYGIERVLAIAETAIDSFGWMSATKAAETYGATSTAQWVHAALLPPSPYDSEDIRAFRAMVATDKQIAEVASALAWARDLPTDVESDYMYNLRTATQGECIPSKRVGLVVSLVATYRREMGRLAEIKRQTDQPSQHVGVIGKRDIFKGLTLVKRGVPNYTEFGPSTLLIFNDADGNSVKWFASGDGDGWDEGTTYNLVATPKKHGEFRNVKETIVNRVATWDGKWKPKK